jgi:radical SAM protein with 4Fe4S-binding SPASM domain
MSDMIKKLKTRNRHLTKMYATEGRLEGVNEWKHFPFYWFPLFMSYKCTRRCPSCYSFNQTDNIIEMSDSMFNRLKEWFVEAYRGNNVKINTIIFLGGEPTLRTDRVKMLLDYLYEHDAPVSAVLYTNGDLIDNINWDDLTDITWMSMNVTDVPLNEVERRMDIIRKNGNIINQTVVAVLDDFNLTRIEDISIMGLENGYRLRFYRNIYAVSDPDYIKRILATYHKLCDLLEKYIAKGGYDVHTTFLLDTLIPQWNLEGNPFHCGRRMAAIFPNGNIGPCLRNHKYITGNITEPYSNSTVIDDLFRMSFRRNDVPDDCKMCEVRKVCQAGCPNDKMIHIGTTGGRSMMCEVHKEIIPRLIILDKLKSEQIK